MRALIKKRAFECNVTSSSCRQHLVPKIHKWLMMLMAYWWLDQPDQYVTLIWQWYVNADARGVLRIQCYLQFTFKVFTTNVEQIDEKGKRKHFQEATCLELASESIKLLMNFPESTCIISYINISLCVSIVSYKLKVLTLRFEYNLLNWLLCQRFVSNIVENSSIKWSIKFYWCIELRT